MSALYARKYYVYGIIICVGLFLIASYLQFSLGLAPCALCQLQRMVLAVLLFFFVIACVHNPARVGIRRYGWLIGVTAGIGAALAGRQIYLQRLPSDATSSCSMTVEYLLNALPLDEAVKMIFKGAGDCSEVVWRFLGITLAEWTFIFFILLGSLGIYSALRLGKLK